MRVFWHQGGLRIEPQNEAETQKLIELLDLEGAEPEPETGSNCQPEDLKRSG